MSKYLGAHVDILMMDMYIAATPNRESSNKAMRPNIIGIEVSFCSSPTLVRVNEPLLNAESVHIWFVLCKSKSSFISCGPSTQLPGLFWPPSTLFFCGNYRSV